MFPGHEIGGRGGFSSVFELFFAKKSLTKTDRCDEALSLQNVGSAFIGVFSSELISQATKDISAMKFPSSSSSCKLYQ